MDKWLKLIWRLENTIGRADNILWPKEIYYIKEKNKRKWIRKEIENKVYIYINKNKKNKEEEEDTYIYKTWHVQTAHRACLNGTCSNKGKMPFSSRQLGFSPYLFDFSWVFYTILTSETWSMKLDLHFHLLV